MSPEIYELEVKSFAATWSNYGLQCIHKPALQMVAGSAC